MLWPKINFYSTKDGEPRKKNALIKIVLITESGWYRVTLIFGLFLDNLRIELTFG